jgi:hypothetical protein
MKCIFQSLWFSLVILIIAFPLVGCQNENEAGVASDVSGSANPKYAKGDDAAYEAYGKDQMKTKAAVKSGAKQK